MSEFTVNAIGAIGTALVTGVFTLLTTIMVKRNRSDTRDVLNVVQQAADNAETAVQNTVNVSNGFAGGVVTKLDTIIRNQDDLSTAFRKHLEWHLDKETPK